MKKYFYIAYSERIRLVSRLYIKERGDSSGMDARNRRIRGKSQI